MAENTWPIAIRFHLRDKQRVPLPFEAYWDTSGFALRDGEGEEHHFGFAEHEGEHMVFTYVASYTAAGRDSSWGGGVHDKLTESAYELVEPMLGSRLSPLVDIALDDLAEFAAHKGFAFDDERRHAVQTFGALHLADELFDPEEVYVQGATGGYRPKDAKMLEEYARRAIEGRGTRTVGRQAIRVDRVQAAAMVKHWRSKLRD
jgi:hypothetical protein